MREKWRRETLAARIHLGATTNITGYPNSAIAKKTVSAIQIFSRLYRIYIDSKLFMNLYDQFTKL